MLPGLVAGWVLLFVRMGGDLTLSALLSGPQNIVVGLRILDIFRNGSYADLAALSMILALVSSLVTIGVLAMSRRFGGLAVR
jgi:iron(III) transport system permease protein